MNRRERMTRSFNRRAPGKQVSLLSADEGATMSLADWPSLGWSSSGRFGMRILAMMGLGLCVFLGGVTLPTSDANAVVCARGYRGAGCVGPRGAVGVRHGPYYRHGVVRVRRW